VVGRDDGEVYAFRVDVTKKQADLDLWLGTGDETCTLARIPLSTDRTPPQTRVSFDHGLIVLGVALNYRTLTSHSVAVRLYRPGFRLVEIKPGDPADRATWEAATGLEAQEAALDNLFGLKGERGRLEPGSASAAHREALLFGASEYDRLASLASAQRSGQGDQGKRLGEKAERLRSLAGS
jgi:hypothetical protein